MNTTGAARTPRALAIASCERSVPSKSRTMRVSFKSIWRTIARFTGSRSIGNR